ncbi:RING-box protein 2 isoform X4 [Sciurus carolinensis]|uniref:RING-box protein 2 isoform X4 n=1 Tax=Sciurus carolinensis TaxID=30640 RepID=UPI001FB344B8|nr:RING-box protein 2 isoform X4 [Sciurus carolinensis]
MARRAAPQSRHSRPLPLTQRPRRRLRAAAMADVEDGEEPCALSSHSGSAGSKSGGDKMFSLKKWNAVAMWSWDVECDTCAICRVQVMDACLRCQAENKQEDCVVLSYNSMGQARDR